jgi:hypothetical protein
MLLRSSAALRCSVLRGRSLRAAAKRAGEMGVVALDIVGFGAERKGYGAVLVLSLI